jgi:hypothetical protein
MEKFTREYAEKKAKNLYPKFKGKDESFSLNEQIQRSGGFIVGFREGWMSCLEETNATELLEACISALDAQTNKEIEAAKTKCMNAINKATL